MSVTIAEKKEFIRWVLKAQHFKRRESVMILNHFLTNDDSLNRVHFVNEAHYCPFSMIMSTTDTEGIPFRYYRGEMKSADAEQAYHYIRTHREEKLYIQINMNNKLHSKMEYINVLEDNPHLPSYLEVNQQDQKITEELIAHVQKQYTENKIREQIDAALDKGSKRLFNKWVKELNEFLEKDKATVNE